MEMSPKENLRKYLREARLRKLYDKVKVAFQKHGLLAHTWDHIYRDIINAVIIGEAEKADMEIVLPSILLHDIGFLYDPDPQQHHLIGAEKCFSWIDAWDESETEKIAECIRGHKGKFPQFAIEPVSLDAKVVHDADLLEKFGNTGILQSMRTYFEFGLSGLDNYTSFKALGPIVKLQSELRELRFYTETGRQLAGDKGGIHKRRRFFLDALAELEIYEEV